MIPEKTEDVLRAIIRIHNEGNGVVGAEVARRSGCSSSSIYIHTKKLIASGHVKRNRIEGSGTFFLPLKSTDNCPAIKTYTPCALPPLFADKPKPIKSFVREDGVIQCEPAYAMGYGLGYMVMPTSARGKLF